MPSTSAQQGILVTLHRVFFWLHLTVGLVVGFLIAFLALTGSIISFQPQLITFAERHLHADHPANTPCVAPSVLLANAARATPKPLTALTLFADPRRPAQIATGPVQNPDGSVLLADSCTGQILGPGANRTRVFLTTVRELHHQAAFAGVRYKALHSLTNAAALAFVFLVLSGLYLWFPRHLTWQHARPSVLLRPGLRGRARDWNLHNLAGFWLCLPLLAISTTGVIMAFPWANNLLYRAAGDTPPPPRREEAPARPSPADTTPLHSGDSSADGHHTHPSRGSRPEISNSSSFAALDVPIARALSYAPATRSITLRLPSPKALASASSLTFQLAENDRGQSMNRDQLTLGTTADSPVLKWEPFTAASRGRHWRIAARYLHTGELFGVPGQAVALTAALGALLLVWTGISLSLRRLAAFRRRRNHLVSTPATTPATQHPLQVS